MFSRDDVFLRWRKAAIVGKDFPDATRTRTIYPFFNSEESIPYWTITDGTDPEDASKRIEPGAAGLMGEWRTVDAPPASYDDVLRRMSGQACLICGTDAPAVSKTKHLDLSTGARHTLPVAHCRVCYEPMMVPTATAAYLLSLKADPKAAWSNV